MNIFPHLREFLAIMQITKHPGLRHPVQIRLSNPSHFQAHEVAEYSLAACHYGNRREGPSNSTASLTVLPAPLAPL